MQQGAVPTQFWFDPVCPWTWITFRWLQEAAQVRDLEVTYRLLSLAMLNEDRETDPEMHANHVAGLELERVISAAREASGPEVVGPLYEAMGTRIHVEGRDLASQRIAIVEESLAVVDLPASLGLAALTTGRDADIRADHDAAMALVGDDVGSPVIAVDGTAFFGPVLSPAPHGEQAGVAWDACVALAAIPGFYELKRSRTAPPDLS
jgi:2-hydroxychromene-2-carboxylate isomerase